MNNDLGEAWEKNIFYLANINEVRLFQIHIEFDEHTQHFITKLLVLHQGHADLQAVGEMATHIGLQKK